MEKTAAEQTRAFRMSLDLDATPDQVWRALTEAEELVRWFPTGARVTPGKGGRMLWSWGYGEDWVTSIDEWEPGKLLRLVQEEARPYDAQGHPLPPGEVEAARIAMEFTLETVQGKTRLRLVHSGFGHGCGVGRGSGRHLRRLAGGAPQPATLSPAAPRAESQGSPGPGQHCGAPRCRLGSAHGTEWLPAEPRIAEGGGSLRGGDAWRTAVQRDRGAEPSGCDAGWNRARARRRLVPAPHLARCPRAHRCLGLACGVHGRRSGGAGVRRGGADGAGAAV